MNFRTKFSTRSYFNSRPSARGDSTPAAQAATHKPISIHAPPRGATPRQEENLRSRQKISIHAPPRGATRCTWIWVQARAYFNSRPSARGDAYQLSRSFAGSLFQFTPLREGRLHRRSSRKPSGDFNSRPSARGDRMTFVRASSSTSFQFTPLREGRQYDDGTRVLKSYLFQFTPLREGRQ